MNLEELREKINIVDGKMEALFEKRMALSKKIFKVKKHIKSPVTDKNREKALIEKNLSNLKNKELSNYYKEFESGVISVSKKYQNSLFNEIYINVGEGYPVYLGHNEVFNNLNNFGEYGRTLLLTDSGIPKKHIDFISSKLNEYGKVYKYVIPCGEENKTVDTVLGIVSFMKENGFDRHDRVVSLGGGVVGDLGGFAASIYMRGIDWFIVPTTLLSMCDSSIGGKTGADYGGVKNCIGTFYQPKAVFTDLRFLKTLDIRQLNNGWNEIIKIFAVLNEDDFENINEYSIKDLVKRAIILKKEIVESDTKENGLRRVLNFGHTVGHAVEMLGLGYLHGECVGIGMLAMSEGDAYDRIRSRLPVDFKIPYDAKEKLKEIISLDKKSENGKIRVIRCDKIGTYYEDCLSVDEIIDLIFKKGLME